VSNQRIGVLFSAEARGPFLLHIDYATHAVPDPVGVGAISWGLKRPGNESYHSFLSMAEIKSAWSYTATLHGMVFNYAQEQIYFYLCLIIFFIFLFIN
jgi:hypothetical protein